MKYNPLSIAQKIINFTKSIFKLDDSKDVNVSLNRIDPFMDDMILHNNSYDYFIEYDQNIEFSFNINFLSSIKGQDLKDFLSNIKKNEKVRYLLKSVSGIRSIVSDEEFYEKLLIILPLVDRDGPISKNEFLEVYKFVEDSQDSFNADFIYPDYNLVFKKAVQLDSLCASIDSYIILNLLLKENLTNAEIVKIANKFGFSTFYKGNLFLERNGCFILISRTDNSSLDISLEKNSSINFILDVPRSDINSTSFYSFYNMAKELARVLDAKLIDSKGFILSDDYVDIINSQLQTVLSVLENNGFKAGSNRARRVFR